jgi:hypothetical protein
MADIRPLERADLPAVVPLVRSIRPDWLSEEEIPSFLASTLIDDPWSDGDLPPLIATADDGEVVGFIGSQVRRFRFGDRQVRGVCPSHLVVVPDRRAGAAGALLLRRLLTAGQDFTFSDTANDEVVRMWRTFGGNLDSARACDWMIVLRPVRWLRGVTAAAIRRRPVGREQVPVGAIPFQAAGPRIARRAFPEPEPEVAGEDVDAAAIVEHLPETTRGLRFFGDHDEQFLDHVFGQVRSLLGEAVRRLVRRGGRPVGWYAYVPDPRGVGRVLHIAANEREAEPVLGELIAHARAQGCALVSGRLEPHLLVPLRRRLAVLGFARQPVIHAHEPELLAALAAGDSLLTRLDSEWFAA